MSVREEREKERDGWKESPTPEYSALLSFLSLRIKKRKVKDVFFGM